MKILVVRRKLILILIFTYSSNGNIFVQKFFGSVESLKKQYKHLTHNFIPLIIMSHGCTTMAWIGFLGLLNWASVNTKVSLTYWHLHSKQSTYFEKTHQVKAEIWKTSSINCYMNLYSIKSSLKLTYSLFAHFNIFIDLI